MVQFVLASQVSGANKMSKYDVSCVSGGSKATCVGVCLGTIVAINSEIIASSNSAPSACVACIVIRARSSRDAKMASILSWQAAIKKALK